MSRVEHSFSVRRRAHPPKPRAFLCDEFLLSHTSTLSVSTQRNHQTFSKTLKTFFKDRRLVEINQPTIEEYRDHRRHQSSERNPKKTVKGATVNRALEYLQCMFEFAVNRKYIAENPAAGVKHFDERRERPSKRMLTADEEQRILGAAPPHLRVAIVLLVQTGGRTYSEGFSLRWDQMDLENSMIHLDGDVKTSESAQPVPLSRLACEVLREWRKEQGSQSPYIFPSPRERCEQANSNCQTGVANSSHQSRCSVLSNLQPASRILYETQLGSTGRCCPARNAPQQPRDETSLSARPHSPGSRAPRTSE